MFKYIIVERTMCYGTCPVYKVKINNSGIVKYDGKMFVSKIGRHEWKIPDEDINKINKLLNTFNYRDFIYDPGNEFATDHPSCITTVKFDDCEVKTINHYLGHFGVDKRLIKFEEKIEKIINVIEYVGVEDYIYSISL